MMGRSIILVGIHLILLVMWLATGALYFIYRHYTQGGRATDKKRSKRPRLDGIEMGMTKAREYLDSHNSSSGPGYVPIMIIFSHV